jgi:hypothetical protein
VIREAAVVAGGFVLSLVLAGAIGYTLIRTSDVQVMVQIGRESETATPMPAERGREFWNSMQGGYFRMAWLYCPGAALLVGCFVGAMVTRHPLPVALIAAAPFAALFSVWTRGPIGGVGFLALYLGAALVGALLVWKARAMRAGRIEPPNNKTQETSHG